VCERAAEAVDEERNRWARGYIVGCRVRKQARCLVGWSKQTGNVNIRHVAAIPIVFSAGGEGRGGNPRVVGFALFLRQSPMRRVN